MSDPLLKRPLRIAGAALIVGALLSLVGAIAAVPAGSVGTFNRTAWVLIHVLLVLGGAALLLGLPALYVRQAAALGVSGLIGVGLLFLGFLGFGFFIPTVQTFLVPWLYDKASCTLGCHVLNVSDGPPLYAWFYYAESLATFLGLVVFGIATARAGIFPRAAGYLMGAAGVFAVPLTFLGVAPVIGLVPEVLALAGVTWMAMELLTEDWSSGAAHMQQSPDPVARGG